MKRAAGKSRSGRKSAKRAGTRTPDIYQAIVANTKDPILVLDQENIIQFVNAAAENFLDQSSDYLLGQKFGYSFNTSSPQEVNVVRSGHDYRIAEIVAHEMQGLDKRFYVINMRDVTEHMRSLERLRSLSNVDPLTGLLNRRGFIAAAQKQLSLAQRTKREMLLIFLDLDNLKQINDSQGHIEGDQGLIEAALILQKTFRQPDILCRYGGDEFSVLALEAVGGSGDTISTRLKNNIEEHNSRKREGKQISMSLGIANFNPEMPIPIEELIERADLRMYEDKRAKKRM